MTPSTETQRILELVGRIEVMAWDAAINESLPAAERIAHQAIGKLFQQVGMEFREAARSAGGEITADDVAAACKKAGLPFTPAAPAPAETTDHRRIWVGELGAWLNMLLDTAGKLEIDGRRYHFLDQVCAHIRNKIDETPGPQPVSEPARAAGDGDQLAATRPHSVEAPGEIASALETKKPGVATGPAPVPTPPDAAQGKAIPQLNSNQVEWVVNDNAELGVKIGQRFFWLYKGGSLVYEEGTHDDGKPMHWRHVFKREFGECAHPINHDDPKLIGTVSLNDSDEWRQLPPMKRIEAPTTTGESGLRECPFCGSMPDNADDKSEHAHLWCRGTQAVPHALVNLPRAIWNTRSTPRAREGDAIPDDVRRLVIAARKVAFEDTDKERLRELDLASEAFADRISWENEDE